MSQNPDSGNWDQPIDEKPKRGQGDNPHQALSGGQGRVIAAIGLIALGVIFLLQQYGVNIPLLHNWWALFILFPGLGALWTGFNTYRQAGRWTMEARGAISGGIMILLVAVIFLFDLDWGKIWPFFLIVPGIMLLTGMLGPRDSDRYR